MQTNNHEIHDYSAILDKIFILKDHKIIDEGTHNELMEKSEEYKRLYQKEAHL